MKTKIIQIAIIIAEIVYLLFLWVENFAFSFPGGITPFESMAFAAAILLCNFLLCFFLIRKKIVTCETINKLFWISVIVLFPYWVSCVNSIKDFNPSPIPGQTNYGRVFASFICFVEIALRGISILIAKRQNNE